MKILVCISQAPDTTTKIAFSDDNTKFKTDGVTYIINPYDEWYALVRALELKEAGTASAVHLVTVGTQSVDPIIRKALALGGDEAIRINTESSDPYTVAAQIAAYAKDKGYDLVLTGKESIDYNNGAVGPMLAEMLDMNYIGHAIKLDIADGKATVDREIEGGQETNSVSLPLVLSCQKGMAEQRIPNMRGIMAARTKPLNVVEPADVQSVTDIVSYELPPAKGDVKLVDPENMDELVSLLHNDAKVI